MSNLAKPYMTTTKLRDLSQSALFRGHGVGDDASVLLKIPSGEHPSPAQLARLRHEYSILSSLSLPGVVRPLGLGKVGETLALVLEDIGWRSLDRVVAEGPAGDLHAFLKVAISMTRVLEALHRQHVIHKDIKPQNFLLGAAADSSDVTLIDFAAATRLSLEDRRATIVSRLEGTLAYMSPEQTGRMNRLLDRRTDLYSLGVAFYELLTGVLPFQTADPLELVHSHIARTPVPPHVVAPATPPVLSAIVMTLLAKNAEDRYQDAGGLRADLERCLASLTPSGEIASFGLGQEDFTDELRIPQKLYGRETEATVLLDLFERTRNGATDLLLISGYSGIGKSALVNELQRQIVRKGRFISGKFDQLGRRVPYLPIARACGDLLKSILAEPPEALASWRAKILAALGPNGQVIVDLVPELQLVIGPQSKVQSLGPNEAQHRFETSFQSFLHVFTSADHPLVFFLDDLQWADAASLRLIHLALTNPRRSHLLIIGAYRDNEVDPVHPLSLALIELRKASAAIHDMKLRPLGLHDVGQLLTDTFGAGRTDSEVAPLAALVLRKTHGNPFFINQFVTDLYQKGLIAWSPDTRRWTWKLAAIEGATATDNVIEFMIAKLRRLGPGSQAALSLAACIGHQFDRRTLAIISEESEADVAKKLWEALREGLLVPVDANQGYLHERGDTTVRRGGPAQDQDDELNPSYRFLHDRVQQAAYALVDEAHKQEAHLRIGRLLLGGPGGTTEERLFDVVNQMNYGVALIADPEERRGLARMNLQAGRKAHLAVAYGLAVKFLATCRDLLGDAAWETDYDAVLPACLTQAECQFVEGNVDEAFRLIDLVQARATSVLDRVAASKLRTLILSHTNRLPEAIRSGLATARLLGMDFPDPDGELGPFIGAELGAVGGALANRDVESLIDLPAADPEAAALLEVLFGIVPAASQSNTPLFVLIVAKAVNLALQRGNAGVSSFFYICYGMVLTGGGEADLGFRSGTLGLRLNERRDVHAIAGAAQFVFGAFVSSWKQPIAASLDHFEKGVKAGMDAGDYMHAAYCMTFLGLYRLYGGASLEEVEGALAAKADLLDRTGNVVNRMAVKLVAQLIAYFRGQTAGRTEFGGPGFDIVAVEKEIVDSRNRFLISTYYLFWAIVHYSGGAFVAAIDDLVKALPAVPPELTTPEIIFFRALATAAALRSEQRGGGDPAAMRHALDQDVELIGKWAAASPGAFGHWHALVAAEVAALDGDGGRALTLYERAILLAKEQRSGLHESLANELCARHARGQGLMKVAGLYTREARASYQRWGGTAKVNELAELAQSLPGGDEARLAAGGGGGATEIRGDQLDAMSFVKASQAISGEIVLAKLIGSLMRIVIEQAGAGRGALVLVHDGQPWLEGVAGTDAAAGGAFQRHRLHADADADTDGADGPAGANALPRSIIEYVRRTREKVLLTDAHSEGLFTADPYFQAHRPRSLLCMPMIRQGALVGLLYLENDLTGDAFRPDRVELLEVLSSQAAVSLENAILYDEMEKRVEDRTRELQASLVTIKKNQAQLIEAERRTAVAHYEREMAIARQIQTSILPRQFEVPGLEIAASMVTASEVGGDYYDLRATADGGCWLGIGDVSGHGLNAGLMMLMIQSSLGTLMRRDPDADPASLVCMMNQLVYDNIRVRLGRDDYATLCLFRFYADGRFVVAGAHEDAIIWRARTGQCDRITTEGVWVGILDDTSDQMPNRTDRLEPGDVMMLYTDGITEARTDAGEQLGQERITEMLGDLHAEPTAVICARILERAQSWASAQDDDQTLVVIRRQAT